MMRKYMLENIMNDWLYKNGIQYNINIQKIFSKYPNKCMYISSKYENLNYILFS